MDAGRISRALNQPLFLMQSIVDEKGPSYIVSGMTSTYVVTLPPCSELMDGKVSSYDEQKLVQSYELTNCKLDNVCCTCPDFSNRNTACKHIFFILLKVLKVHCNKNLTHRQNYWQHVRRGRAKSFIQKAKNILYNERPDNAKGNEECSICLDEFQEQVSDQIICYCHGCGHQFHSLCMSIWIKTQKTKKKSCPLCRHAFN